MRLRIAFIGPVRDSVPRRPRSAAGSCLRDVTFNRVDVSAINGSDKTASAIIDVNLRNRVDVELLYHCGSPIHDVDLAQCNVRIASCHLLQTWRELSARPAPVRIKIDDGYAPEREMFVDVHLRAVRNHFNRLTAAGHGSRAAGSLCGVSSGTRGIVMKTLLNFFRQLDEIKFRNSRSGSKHNAVRLDSANRNVFVFFPVNRFEIFSDCNGRKTRDQKGENLHLVFAAKKSGASFVGLWDVIQDFSRKNLKDFKTRQSG